MSKGEIIEIFEKQSKYDEPLLNIIDDETKQIYEVGQSIVSDFFTTYCENVYNESEQDLPLNFYQSGKNFPLRVEFKLSFKGLFNKESDLFNCEFEDNVYRLICDVIRDTFIINDKNLKYIVLHGGAIKNENRTYIRVCFHFPYIRTSAEFYNKELRSKIIQTFNINNILRNLKIAPEKPIDEIVIRLDKFWLYGSSKYKYFNNHSVLRSENIYDHSFFKNEIINIEEIENKIDSLKDEFKFQYVLPILLDIEFLSQLTKIREKANSEVSADISVKLSITKEMKLLDEFLGMLGKNRWNERIYFKDIGRAIQTTYNNSPEGLEYWKNKTIERESIFAEDDCKECIELYYLFGKHGITLKTMARYASIDSPDKYKKWHSEWIDEALQDAINNKITDLKITEVFYRIYWQDLMFDGDNKKWMLFDNHTLKIVEGSLQVSTKIVNFITWLTDKSTKYANERNDITRKSEFMRDKHYEDAIETINKIKKDMESIDKIITKISSHTYMNKIAKTSEVVFSMPFKPLHGISTYLDANINYIGMPNGVIEFDYWGKKGEGGDGKYIFRNGKPEDYITKKMGIPYRSDLNKDSPEVKEAYKYYEEVFSDSEQREYQYVIFADMLLGGNVDKYWHIWTGDTNGSKSIRQKIEMYMLGNYAVVLPPEIYFAKNKGKGPTPELAQLSGARMAYTSEPDDNETITGSRIKSFTGGDAFFARNNRENGGFIVPTHKTVIIQNSMPKISKLDEATLIRFLFEVHTSRWIGQGEDMYDEVKRMTEEERKKKCLFIKDDSIEERIPFIAQGLLYICLEYFPISRQKGIKPPKTIKEEIKKYWQKHDVYSKFIIEKLENTENQDDIIEINDLFKVFRRWYKSNYDEIVDVETFETMMTERNRLGKTVDSKWYGWKFK